MRWVRPPWGWSVLAVLVFVTATAVVVTSHRVKGWSETGTIVYEFGFVAVLGVLPVVVGMLASGRTGPLVSGRGPRRLGDLRIASVVMIAGGLGMLVGRPLAEFDPPGPVWTRDAAFPLALILVALATWNFLEFGSRKLLAIGLLAAGGLLFTVYDVGAAPPVWDRGYAGVELVGIWLFCASAVVVLLGALGSAVTECRAEVVQRSAAPPPRPGSASWWRSGAVLVTGTVVALWAVGFVVGNVERLQAAREGEEHDRGPLQPDLWSVDIDGAGDGVPSIHMVTTFGPLEESDVEEVGGRLVWDRIEIELCGVDIRATGDALVQVGDIFSAADACDGGTGMLDAFDEFGLPVTACVHVRSHGVEDEHCAPLAVETSADVTDQ